MKKPTKLVKAKGVFTLTKYGSYVDSSLDGMTQQKNTSSYKELIKPGEISQTMLEKRGYCNQGTEGCDSYRYDHICRCY